ncbi:MAG TPA: hypothetical protein VKV39_11860 [Candidatus Sulfotelmatobacter sp.]|nr:hypothetical protein [Candidatus Sulfotelmatobacter sp.]
MNYRLAFIASSLVVLFFVGCGGSGNKSHTQPPPAITVSISPSSSAILVNETTSFTATVTGASNTAVTWSVTEQAGGTVNAGTYQAPWANGTYHVVATSVSDSTKSASATVSVSAQFAFLQQLPTGTSLPFSVTPILGTFGADGKFTTTNINDPKTGNPLDTSIASIFLSSDGKKVVFEMVTQDNSGKNTDNIYTANADGTGLTQLTFNVPGDGNYAVEPQFSPDGQKITYTVFDNTSTWGESLWAMNTDGTNQIQLSDPSTIGVGDASFSPDGSKIVALVENYGASGFYGIAVMNPDTSNIVPLESGPQPSCFNPMGGYGWGDELPAFTNDGQHIAFSEVCWPTGGGMFETVYIMNADGTNVTRLHGDAATFVSSEPRAVADRLVFSTNVDYPGTDQFEMYSVALDGSNLTRLTNNTMYDGFSVSWMNHYSAPSMNGSQLPTGAWRRIERLRRMKERHSH